VLLSVGAAFRPARFPNFGFYYFICVYLRSLAPSEVEGSVVARFLLLGPSPEAPACPECSERPRGMALRHLNFWVLIIVGAAFRPARFPNFGFYYFICVYLRSSAVPDVFRSYKIPIFRITP
jgi:hypothetical protein